MIILINGTEAFDKVYIYFLVYEQEDKTEQCGDPSNRYLHELYKNLIHDRVNITTHRKRMNH